MPRIWVYYEENAENNQLEPIRLNIRFGAGKILWEKSYVYLPIEAPFERKTAEDGYDELVSLSITQGELVMHPDRLNHYGIHLPSVIERVEKMRIQERQQLGFSEFDDTFDYNAIEQFIIQLTDLEEVMQMDVSRIFDWR